MKAKPDEKTIAGWIEKGRLLKASHACRELIDKENSAEAIYLLAVISERKGLMSEAANLFRSAVDRLPDRADIAYNFGTFLQRIGRLPEAAAEWRRAAALDPSRTDARFNLARALTELGELEDSLETYRQLAVDQPSDAVVFYNLGNSYFRLGRLREARESLERSLELDPKPAKSWINLGLSELRDGDAGAALRSFDRAVERDPENILAHINRSYALLHLGRMAEGYAEFEWRRRVLPLRFEPGPMPAWQGEDPNGKTVLVYMEQGHGDAIQFLRYTRVLADQGVSIRRIPQGRFVLLMTVGINRYWRADPR